MTVKRSEGGGDEFSPEARRAELHRRLVADENAMRVARYVHRSAAFCAALVLIVLPLIVATDLVASGTWRDVLLITVSAVGAFQGVFQPALRSVQRRADWIEMTRLRDRFVRAVYQTKGDAAKLDVVLDKFSAEQAAIWRRRGDTLTEAGLLKNETPPKAKEKDDEA